MSHEARIIRLPLRGAPPAPSAAAQTYRGTLHAEDGSVLEITVELPAPTGDVAPVASPASDADTEFRLQVELDVEHERLVLYRSFFVAVALGVLVLFRTVLLHGG